MSPAPLLNTLETDHLTLRRQRVSDAGVYRQLWTERDVRVPPHRRIDLEGRPTEELLRAVHNCGYATEAGWAVVTWAGEAGYRRLWATVWDWNVASRRVLEKLGFRETGRVSSETVDGRSLLTVREF